MDRYEQLRQLLHQHPSGAPKSAYFDEILRLLFTPEEVEVALGMGFRLQLLPVLLHDSQGNDPA